jgi:hypothetical protein
MTKLEYALTLIKSLAYDANEEQNDNDARFYTNLFRLYVNGRQPFPIPSNPARLSILKSSVELLLKYTTAENVSELIKGFMRDSRPEHIPAYNFLFNSISPNHLDEETLRRINTQIRIFIEQDNPYKLEIIIKFLIGYNDPMSRGVRDYDLLFEVISRVARRANQNSNASMGRQLAIRKRRELLTPLGRRPVVREFYNRLIPRIEFVIDRFPDLRGGDYIVTLLEPVN